MSRSLATGTICGNIHLYSVDLETPSATGQCTMKPSSQSVLKLLQTLPVCGGSVRCLTWSKDSRSVSHKQGRGYFGHLLLQLAWWWKYCMGCTLNFFRLLAVGGSDDNIQILQSSEPKVSTKPIPSSSILNYCKIHVLARQTYSSSFSLWFNFCQ